MYYVCSSEETFLQDFLEILNASEFTNTSSEYKEKTCFMKQVLECKWGILYVVIIITRTQRVKATIGLRHELLLLCIL